MSTQALLNTRLSAEERLRAMYELRKSTEPKERITEALMGCLDDASEIIRKSALSMLGEFPHPIAESRLIEMANKEDEEGRLAMCALARWGREDVIVPLAERLFGTKSRKCQGHAISAVKYLGQGTAKAVLEAWWAADVDEELRHVLAVVLPQVGSRMSEEYLEVRLRSLTDHDEEDLYLPVIFGLATMGNRHGISRLKDLILRGGFKNVKLVQALCIAFLGDSFRCKETWYDRFCSWIDSQKC